MTTSAFQVSSFDRFVDDNGDREKLWVVEVRDLARGFCGALFLALPLLYTLEMWERARLLPMWDIVVIVAVAYLGNVGFALFNGFKRDLRRKAAWFDAITAMGIGIFAYLVSLAVSADVTDRSGSSSDVDRVGSTRGDFWIDRDPLQGTPGFDIGSYRVS